MRLSFFQNQQALLFLSILLFSSPAFSETSATISSLPIYNPLKLEAPESISSVGSDSMKNLMESLVEEYNKIPLSSS